MQKKTNMEGEYQDGEIKNLRHKMSEREERFQKRWEHALIMCW